MNSFVKQPAEQFTISIDFDNLLDTDETISTKTVSAVDSAGTSVTSTIIDSSSISTTKILVVVKAGTTNTQYKITVRITTSASNTYEEDVYMKVIDT